MTDSTLDRLLAVLLAALLITGPLTWRAGTPDSTWLYVLHGLLAALLLAAVAVKLRRSLSRAMAHRRWRRLGIAVPMAILALLSLGAGFVWVAGGTFVQLGPWTLLGWHGIFGLLLIPLLVVHLLPRRWRLLRLSLRARPAHADRAGVERRPLARRAVISAGAMGIVALALWSTAGALDLFGGRPRRFTGSRWLPSGGIPIPTTFFGEGTPAIDASAWRLRVRGAVARPAEYALPDLAALGESDLTAVLDCTGGWAMETKWRGVPMTALLDAARPLPGARWVEVRSVTGWGAALSIDEARRTFLATGVAGVALPAANGAPCRLVVPDRRGLDWVKWVREVVVA